MSKETIKKIKTLRGEVVSSVMDKTVVVNISRIKTHPLYHKQYTVNNKLKVHDENNDYNIGDIVEIAPTKPLSKEKKYTVIRKIS